MSSPYPHTFSVSFRLTLALYVPYATLRSLHSRRRRNETNIRRSEARGEEWGEVDSVPVIILVLLSIILSSYNPYPSETGPKGRAPVSPAHLTSFGAGKRAPPGMVSGVNRVPVVFSLSFTPLLITHSRLSLVSSPFTPRSWREASRATPGGDERGGKGHETRIRMRFTCHASPSSPYRSAPKAGQRPNRTGRGWDRGGIWCSGKPLVSLTLPASLPRYATSRPHSSLSRRSFVVCSVSRVA